MEDTKFRKIVVQIQALVPLCQFHKARSLCPPDALFFRNRYNWLNAELDVLLSGIR